MAERIAVFIDGGYCEKITMNEFGGVKIDHQLLSTEMTEGLSHLRTYYYNCLPYQSQPPTTEGKERFANRQKFYNMLERLKRYNVRLGKLKYRGLDQDNKPIFEQKGVDVFLSTDLVLHATKRLITHAAMLICDSDFIPAIKVAQNEGVLIRLYHSNSVGKTHELWQCADERYIIDQTFIDKIKYVHR